MKTQTCCLVFVTAVGLCLVPVFAEDLELPLEHQPLLARPNPTLAGIAELNVVILPPDDNSSYAGLVWAELDAKVQRALKEAGVEVKPLTPLPRPELRINIDVLEMPGAQQYVFRVQVSLGRDVVLPSLRNLTIKPDVWKTVPAMQAVSVKKMPEKVTEVVLNQIQSFASVYKIANPKGPPPADADATAGRFRHRPLDICMLGPRTARSSTDSPADGQ
jgi:hypothetical protein